MSEFLAKRRERLLALKRLRESGRAAIAPARPTCPSCNRALSEEALADNQRVCPYCGHHFPLTARARLRLVMDDGAFRELDAALTSRDPLQFPGYPEKLRSLRASTQLADAVVTATGKIGGRKVVAAALDSSFLMGSMGAVVGEKLTRAIERAAKQRLPLIVFSASGGARMQEGIISLMQMAKTSAAIERFSAKGGLFISVLTHPTTGGVTASFASLGDIMLAEPGALIGFAGPRVIEQTIGEQLPEGFQTAEFLVEHGFLDAVVPRARLRTTLMRLLELHGEAKAVSGKGAAETRSAAASALTSDAITPIAASARVALARHPQRPGIESVIEALFTNFFEQRGDRGCRDDAAIMGGVALFHGRPVTVIGHRKGADIEKRVAANFGMPAPEGYRKAQRLMRSAEKFGRPIITFVDTPGAYPGLEAEEHGQGEAIARSIELMSALTVPVIAVIMGEGGSGGALALAVGNRVLMLENAVYSVLSPEGFASILWKDASRADEACEAMKLTAADLLELGVVDGIVPEPEGGAHECPQALFQVLDTQLTRELAALAKMKPAALADDRYQKFRAMGTAFVGKGRS